MRAVGTAQKKESGWGWVISIAIAVAVAVCIRTFIFEPIFVSGESMIPTLNNGESLGVEKFSRYSSLPARGEIVIVTDPDNNETLVKRVVGLPGDTVEVKNSTLYINGKAQSEPYVSKTPYNDFKAVMVPPDTIFVMGDNRANSKDSRFFGPVSKNAIIGHALFVIWPLNEIHSIS
jgi:signal peptidase I, bacterial type